MFISDSILEKKSLSIVANLQLGSVKRNTLSLFLINRYRFQFLFQIVHKCPNLHVKRHFIRWIFVAWISDLILDKIHSWSPPSCRLVALKRTPQNFLLTSWFRFQFLFHIVYKCPDLHVKRHFHWQIFVAWISNLILDKIHSRLSPCCRSVTLQETL